MIVINGNDDSIYKKNINKVIISETENNSIDKNYTLLQTNFIISWALSEKIHFPEAALAYCVTKPKL